MKTSAKLGLGASLASLMFVAIEVGAAPGGNGGGGGSTGLDANEASHLTFMREEEKLARDVYLALYDVWGMPVFQNISGSERVHMDSILMLLEQYGLDDPAADTTPVGPLIPLDELPIGPRIPDGE